MEIQACEKADEIASFMKSFGNHNTTLSSGVTSELVKYNMWFKKFFGHTRLPMSGYTIEYWGRLGKEKDVYLADYPNSNIALNWSNLSEKEYITIVGALFKKPFDNCKNPQKLSIIEMALCYGMTLDYEKMAECWQNKEEKDVFRKHLFDLMLASKLKILDSAMFTLIESDILADDKLSVFSVANISDYIVELLALGKSPSMQFMNIIDEMIDLTRDGDTSVSKVMEQYAFLPHTLEDDLVYNANLDNPADVELLKQVKEVSKNYAEASQLVTDSTTFCTEEELDEELYVPVDLSDNSLNKMNMYG